GGAHEEPGTVGVVLAISTVPDQKSPYGARRLCVSENSRGGTFCRNWSLSWMTFTVTALPSPAETHGSHSPNVTAPLVSTAPRLPSGSRFRAIASQLPPLDAAEKEPTGVNCDQRWRRLSTVFSSSGEPRCLCLLRPLVLAVNL